MPMSPRGPNLPSPLLAPPSRARESGFALSSGLPDSRWRSAIRGDAGYPTRLEARAGEAAPGRVWIAGAPGRIDEPQIAFVGSRSTPRALCSAARRFARTLSEDDWVITSGLARGADAAAHSGAAEAGAGTLAIPACGPLHAERRLAPQVRRAATLLCLAPPSAPFNAGYAIRRNGIVAALCDVLVLVATGHRGGSWYAVREAMRLGTPVICLVSGRQTPEGNAWLVRSGAPALPVGASPDEVRSRIRELHATARDRFADSPRMEPMDLFR